MNSRAFTRFQFWAAVALLVGFFLPWLSLGGILSIPGYQVADMVRQESNKTIEDSKSLAKDVGYRIRLTPEAEAKDAAKLRNAQIQLAASYAIYAIPLVALLCIILELRGVRRAGRQAAYGLAALLPLGLLALFYWQLNDDGQFLQKLSFGAWLTAAAGVLLLAAALAPSGIIRSPAPKPELQKESSDVKS